MVIHPKIRGFICTTAHPVGCAANVQRQIDYVKNNGQISGGAKKVLVIGASQGFGFASRISSTFTCGADTLGVFFEKPPKGNKPASAGWYQTCAFEDAAAAEGRYAKSINGDAFSDGIKQLAIKTIKEDMGQVDLVVYSLASPRRTHPKTGIAHSSTLKPRLEAYRNKTVNSNTGEISQIELLPASQDEIDNTVTVMGGEDWKMWMDALSEAGVLAQGASTVAYSYIGPEVTQPIYANGTIGAAKRHLEDTGLELDKWMATNFKGRAFVSVNKALVTQSSSAIPVIPLYISILYKVMKQKNVHEGCIEQIDRLYRERLYTTDGVVPVDKVGRIRVDDWELRDDIQDEVKSIWPLIETENFKQNADFDGYHMEFLALFGFGFESVDYDADIEHDVPIKGLVSLPAE
tara:strand:+ start:6467 stop:7681 length:1215 start_codon:yes stop_codon:yes gene_type:complete